MWTYCSDQNPDFLNYICVSNGFRPPKIGKGFNYCFIGKSASITINALSQLYSGGNFWAISIHRNGYKEISQFAKDAGLTNVDFIEKNSLNLASANLPDFDYIIIDGIYSFISLKSQTKILQFIDKNLKRGGIAYISYDCLPGASPKKNIFDFIRSYSSLPQIKNDIEDPSWLEILKVLKKNNARFIQENPSVTNHIDELAILKKHTDFDHILNEEYIPYTSLEISDSLKEIGMTFAGSTSPYMNLIDLAVPTQFQNLLKIAKTRSEFEIIGDYVRNQSFRADIFVKHSPSLTERQQTKILTKTLLGSIKIKEKLSRSIEFNQVTLNYSHELFEKLIDHLSSQAKTITELSALDDFDAYSADLILDAIRFLVAGGEITLFSNKTAPMEFSEKMHGRFKLNGSFNLEILKRRIFKGNSVPLLGLKAGIALEISMADALFLLCSVEAPADKVALWALERLKEAKQEILTDGKTELQIINDKLGDFRRFIMPKILELGIISPVVR